MPLEPSRGERQEQQRCAAVAMPNLPRLEEPCRLYKGEEMTEKLKVVFAPGCFDNFDGTEEELAAMLADIHQMVEDGTIMDHAVPVDPEEEAKFIELMQNRMPRQ